MGRNFGGADWSGIDRRQFLQSAVLSGTSVSALSGLSGLGAAEATTFTVQQGDTSVEIEPVQRDETVESFYDVGGSEDPFQKDDTSQFFFYEGTDGLSLVFAHDARDGTSGSVTMVFDGLPSDGSWVVEDDNVTNDFANAPDRIEWNWGGCCGDGGAFGVYKGGFPDDFEITVDASNWNGLSRWVAVSGSIDNIAAELDMNEPVTISAGASGGETTPTPTPDPKGIGEKLDQKKRIIEQIRNDVYGETPGDNTEYDWLGRSLEIEENAEALRNRIEANYQSATDEKLVQYEEGITRMLQMENITLTAVDEPIPVIRKTVKKGALAVLGAALEKLFDIGKLVVGGLGRIGRWVLSQLESVSSQFRILKTGSLDLSFLPEDVRTSVRETLNELEAEMDRLTSERRQSLIEGVEAGLGSGLKVIADYLEDTTQLVSNVVDDVVETLYTELYSMYVFNGEASDIELSVPLPWLTRLSQSLDPSPSIDTALEEQMAILDQSIENNDLSTENRNERETMSNGAASHIINVTDDINAGFEKVETEIVDPLEDIELVTIFSGLSLYAVDLLKGGVAFGEIFTLAEIGSALLSVSSLLGAVLLVLISGQAVFGLSTLLYLSKVHSSNTFAIADYDLLYKDIQRPTRGYRGTGQ